MATLTETQDAYDRHHLHGMTLHADVADVIIKLEAERDAAKAELKTRTQDFTRLIEEAQALLRPQAEWEQEIAELRASASLAVNRWRRSEAIRRASIDQVITQGETITALERQLAELSQLVGAETPIAAFTLAQAWYAEKAAYQEEIAAAALACATKGGHDDTRT